jgi:hypothetical protein
MANEGSNLLHLGVRESGSGSINKLPVLVVETTSNFSVFGKIRFANEAEDKRVEV